MPDERENESTFQKPIPNCKANFIDLDQRPGTTGIEKTNKKGEGKKEKGKVTHRLVPRPRRPVG
jgi:hypothetical protein